MNEHDAYCGCDECGLYLAGLLINSGRLRRSDFPETEEPGFPVAAR